MVGMKTPSRLSRLVVASLVLVAILLLGACEERKVSRTRWSTPDAFDRNTKVGDSRESTRPPTY